jgi:hypothetical protein
MCTCLYVNELKSAVMPTRVIIPTPVCEQKRRHTYTCMCAKVWEQGIDNLPACFDNQPHLLCFLPSNGRRQSTVQVTLSLCIHTDLLEELHHLPWIGSFRVCSCHRRIGRFDRSRAAVRLQTFFHKTPTRSKLFWPPDFFRLADFLIFTVRLRSDYSGTKVWQTTGHEDA